MATNQIATLGVKVDPRGAVTGANRAKRAITGIGNSARNVKNRIMSMQGALLGLGAGAVLKSIITTASSVESLQVRLKFLTGSTEEAAEAFKVMNDFASKVPFSLEEIERASPLLLTVAKNTEELNELLAITGDIAAISGLSFEATAGQLQRSMAGGIASADLFRERGVKAFLGFKEGVQYNAQQTGEMIKKMFRDGTTTAKGATKELAGTFQGQVSMMQDAFRELKLVIADAGIFELTAEAVKKLTELLKDEQTIENMKKFGEGITTIGRAMGSIVTTLLALPPYVAEFGIVMAFLGGRKAKIVLAGLTTIALGIDAITKAIKNAKTASEEFNGVAFDFKPFMTDDGLKEHRANLLALSDLTHHNFEKMADDVIDFSGTYIEHVKKTADVNKWLKSIIGGDTRNGLPEHLRMLSDETDKVSGSFYRNKTATEIMGAEFDRLANLALLAKEKTKEFADGMATNIEDSIMRMTQGLMSFKDVVKNVFSYVASEMIRANIAKPLASSLSGILTGSKDYGGKGDGGVLGSIFGSFLGKRATGGNVNAGQPYMVGERGAELFVPKGSGDIVPNNKMGGSTVVNVTYAPQVNALDPRTASTVLIENAPLIVGVIRQAFERNGQQVAL